jgi:hypothetical protein
MLACFPGGALGVIVVFWLLWLRKGGENQLWPADPQSLK